MAELEVIEWKCDWKVHKYHGEIVLPFPYSVVGWDINTHLLALPYETIEEEGNLLMYGGASALWQRLIGTGITAFDNSNAHLGVGDSSTAAAATQTDLQASTNKFRKAMEASFPSHTDGTGSSNATISYKSSYSTAQANFAWNEWGLFNASSAGRMLNRKVSSMGTKTSSDTWTLTVNLTLA